MDAEKLDLDGFGMNFGFPKVEAVFFVPRISTADYDSTEEAKAR